MLTATMGALHLVECESGIAPGPRIYQVFGMRPYLRSVVAGAGAGVGRVPPSTLYTRVLALKGGLCLRSAGGRQDHEPVGHREAVPQLTSDVAPPHRDVVAEPLGQCPDEFVVARSAADQQYPRRPGGHLLQ